MKEEVKEKHRVEVHVEMEVPIEELGSLQPGRVHQLFDESFAAVADQECGMHLELADVRGGTALVCMDLAFMSEAPAEAFDAVFAEFGEWPWPAWRHIQDVP